MWSIRKLNGMTELVYCSIKDHALWLIPTWTRERLVQLILLYESSFEKEIQSSTCSSTGYFQRFHHDGVLSFDDYEQLSSCTLRKHDLFVEVGSMDHCIQRIILFVLEHHTCFISTSHMFIYSFSQFWFTHYYRASSRARSLISPNAKKFVAKNNVPCAMRQGNFRNGWQIWSRWW